MKANINRHAYTNYTGKPYIFYNSVPYEINAPDQQSEYSSQFDNRTIIRTNKSVCNNKTDDHSINKSGCVNKNCACGPNCECGPNCSCNHKINGKDNLHNYAAQQSY